MQKKGLTVIELTELEEETQQGGAEFKVEILFPTLSMDQLQNGSKLQRISFPKESSLVTSNSRECDPCADCLKDMATTLNAEDFD